MTKDEIIKAIDNRVLKSKGSQFSDWHIGITNTIEDIKGKYGNPRFFDTYEVSSKHDVNFIIDYFKKRGMKVLETIVFDINYIFIF